MKLKREENGEMMIEAIVVVVTAVVLIFFTMNVGIMYHNRNVLHAIANESATAIANVYDSIGKEPFYGYTDPAFFAGRDAYRHTGFKLENKAEEKGKWYASYLVNEYEFSTKKMDFSGITVDCERNDLGQRVVKVCIKKKYPVFVAMPSEVFGLDLRYEIETEGIAVCYDVLHQMNAVTLIDEMQSHVVDKSLVLSSVKAISDMVEAFSKAKEANKKDEKQ